MGGVCGEGGVGVCSVWVVCVVGVCVCSVDGVVGVGGVP